MHFDFASPHSILLVADRVPEATQNALALLRFGRIGGGEEEKLVEDGRLEGDEFTILDFNADDFT